jgi:hypothetical protein
LKEEEGYTIRDRATLTPRNPKKETIKRNRLKTIRRKRREREKKNSL